MHADVLAEVSGRCLAGPWARHHQRRARRQPVAERFEATDVGGVARAEVVAVDDEQPIVRAVAQAFCERRHGEARYPPPGTWNPPHAPHKPGPRGAGRGRGFVELGSVRGVGRDRERPGETVLGHRQLDEQTVVVAVHVREQPAVHVTGLAVALEADGRAGWDQFSQVVRGLGPVALDRRAGLVRLRRVDADQAHVLLGVADLDDDGVAVDHSHDRGPAVVGGRGLVSAAAQQQGGEGNGEPSTHELSSSRRVREEDRSPPVDERAGIVREGYDSEAWTAPERRCRSVPPHAGRPDAGASRAGTTRQLRPVTQSRSSTFRSHPPRCAAAS